MVVHLPVQFSRPAAAAAERRLIALLPRLYLLPAQVGRQPGRLLLPGHLPQDQTDGTTVPGPPLQGPSSWPPPIRALLCHQRPVRAGHTAAGRREPPLRADRLRLHADQPAAERPSPHDAANEPPVWPLRLRLCRLCGRSAAGHLHSVAHLCQSAAAVSPPGGEAVSRFGGHSLHCQLDRLGADEAGPLYWRLSHAQHVHLQLRSIRKVHLPHFWKGKTSGLGCT